jgi:hypothetical protein
MDHCRLDKGFRFVGAMLPLYGEPASSVRAELLE